MSWFGKKEGTSVAFVEIGADSVGGAYVRYQEGALPQMVYSKRIIYVPREDETAPPIIARALSELGELMIREGAPALARATGSGSVGDIVTSVAVPWQEATIRVEKFESTRPFTFTRGMVKEALEHSATVPAGKVLAEESVIATMLNGYEIKTPYGKRVSRASVVVLAAAVEETIAEAAATALRALFHSHKVQITGFTRAEYTAVRALFPHEDEYLILEARGASTSLLLVKRDCLVGAMTIPSTSGDWTTDLKSSLDMLARDTPLPHTIFLLADDARRDALKLAIEQAHFETLWLSEGPPRVIPITPELTLPHITPAADANRDLFLTLLALSYAHGEEPL